jgi:hypothetical protein
VGWLAGIEMVSISHEKTTGTNNWCQKGERAFIGLVDIIRKRVIGKRQEPRYATSLPAFREA